MKKITLYVVGIIISIFLIIASMTVLGNTKILAPVLIVLCAYIFMGCLIKLCKLNEKDRKSVV